MPAVIFTPISIVLIYGTAVLEKGFHLLKTQPIHSSNSLVVDICFVLIKINLCRKTKSNSYLEALVNKIQLSEVLFYGAVSFTLPRVAKTQERKGR